MDYTDILSFVGGVALFLFGMTYMGDALKKRAGGQMKIFLSKVTSNPIKGFAVGMFVTMVIQSSTATTVMVVSFVNSGMMMMEQATPVVIGSTLGTTITAWIVSLSSISGAGVILTLLKPASFTPVVCMIGVILYKFLTKGRNNRDIGTILIGFALLMYGMTTMSSSMSGLSDVPEFMQVFEVLSNPFFGVLFGIVMAGVMQSSSAAVGVLQALAMAGGITFSSVIPIVMGINIGQVVPVLISSMGTSLDARRIAVISLYLNAAGAVIMLPVYMILTASGIFPFNDVYAVPVTIAICHTGYKLLTVLFELPMYKLFIKLGELSIREVKNPKEYLLDRNFLTTPALALALCRQRVGECIKAANDSYAEAVSLMDEWDQNKAKNIHRAEELVDWYQDEIETYLAQLSVRAMTEKESIELTYLLHVIADYENISDHIYHIVVTLNRLWTNNESFSEDAVIEMKELSDMTSKILRLSEQCFYDPDSKVSFKVISMDQRIVKSCEAAREAHMSRLMAGRCSVAEGSVFTDLLLDFERISDHLSKEARQSLFDSYKNQGTGAKRFLSMLLDQEPSEEDKLKRDKALKI